MRRQTPSTIGPCRSTSVVKANSATTSRWATNRSRSCRSENPLHDPAVNSVCICRKTAAELRLVIRLFLSSHVTHPYYALERTNGSNFIGEYSMAQGCRSMIVIVPRSRSSPGLRGGTNTWASRRPTPAVMTKRAPGTKVSMTNSPFGLGWRIFVK
jgi:hypothetical protein